MTKRGQSTVESCHVEMWGNMYKRTLLLLIALAFLCAATKAQGVRWTEKEAADWYAKQPWLVGSNYIPAYAINELEMWQADTFDP